MNVPPDSDCEKSPNNACVGPLATCAKSSSNGGSIAGHTRAGLGPAVGATSPAAGSAAGAPSAWLAAAGGDAAVATGKAPAGPPSVAGVSVPDEPAGDAATVLDAAAGGSGICSTGANNSPVSPTHALTAKSPRRPRARAEGDLR